MRIVQKWYFITVLFVLGLQSLAEGQTCSCAGAPLISSQSVSSVSGGNLLFGLTYEYKDISNIYSGSEPMDHQSVTRNTQSTLLEISYGITDRLTVSGTATFVRKYRETGLQSPVAGDVLITKGIGDGLVMLKYVLHQNTIQEQYQLAVGGGAKVPFGRSNLTQDGLTLNADMQPGSGAWDGVIWSYFSKSFAPATTLNFFLYSTYRRTGTNQRFGDNDRYKFGNELIVNTGVSNKINSKLSYIAMAGYRSTSSDMRNGNPMPDTGGKWVSLNPSLRYQLSNGISLKASGQIPIYQHLNGLQPTTAFSTSLSVFYNFSENVIF